MSALHPMTHGKSLVYGDCLEVMDRWLAEGHAGKADLIYLDPPFNSNADYSVLYGKEVVNGAAAQVVAFRDTWTWGGAAEERLDELRTGGYPDAMRRAANGLEAILGECGMLAYLTYMAQRLHRCRRMLSDTGSIYLHCDPTASHYLKVVMDAVFGKDNYRNEITWKRYRGKRSGAKYKYCAVVDSLLFYGMSKEAKINTPFHPLRPEYVRKTYKYDDNDGLGPYRFGGRLRDRKYYLANSRGIPVTNLWDDVDELNGTNPEATGYPTQKPVALLERIITASSEKGGLVLDPFCGCGTTVVAANRLKRRWIGIDISAFPVELIRSRLRAIRKQIHVEGIPRDMKGAHLLAQKPFEFEKWAIALTPGLLPNEKQTGDGGVDGRGRLQSGIADEIKPATEKTPLVIAQVTKSPAVNLDKIGRLRASMEEQKALFGVYITLEKINITPSLTRMLAKAGKVKQGATEYPRLQFWSVEEYFQGRAVNLPPLATPRVLARGAAKASIVQGELDSDSF